MEDISQPMEVNEVVLVNEVDLGDDTTTHSITLGAAGSGNAPDQPVTTTGPTDSHTVGSVPTPGDVSTGTSVFEKK